MSFFLLSWTASVSAQQRYLKDYILDGARLQYVSMVKEKQQQANIHIMAVTEFSPLELSDIILSIWLHRKKPNLELHPPTTTQNKTDRRPPGGFY